MTDLSDTILVTGSAGFIGANFVLHQMAQNKGRIVSLDKLTYAGNRANLSSLDRDQRHTFIHGDITDKTLFSQILTTHRPKALINFAAESHVDRSIHAPEDFIQTNVVGTFHLLEATRDYFETLSALDQRAFRFLHVSTDEVYGSLSSSEPAFTEEHPYAPNSPYAASKAASDHLVRAYYHTYGLPVLTTNCSNNYGPYQFPEKLIPLMINNALTGQSLPVYGDGQNIRDWLYVGDHCSAISKVLETGRIGETYNIGSRQEMKNIDVVHKICDTLDHIKPSAKGQSYRAQITLVKDRPGHDRRYAIDASKIEKELGWKPQETFTSGLEKTIHWYLENQPWVESVTNGSYRQWVKINYEAGIRAHK